MPDQVRRIYVEKDKKFNIEAQNLFLDLTKNLGMERLESIRIAYCYDIMGLSDEEYENVHNTIFAPSYTDLIYHEELSLDQGDRVLASQYIAGQYDQRAEAIARSIQSITLGDLPLVRTTKVIILKGEMDDGDYSDICSYIINPVESIQVSLDKPKTLAMNVQTPYKVDTIQGFINASHRELKDLMGKMGFAMDIDDLLLCQGYFRDEEKRDPTITEMRMLDTYWSDHCRHTTFLTRLENIDFEEGFAKELVNRIFDHYKESRAYVYGDREKDISLMDIATISMKEMRKRGMLEDLDESEEINACSISITANVNGQDQEWLVMFKNETHNHPTEIEPFGGASTCLGGAIRDPLSGRSYVYQAMRITGSGDPRTDIHETLEGKLPQLKITNIAAAGYSSYGNQIGLPSGQVVEIYDPGYVAKRMELGALVAAAPRENVVRSVPKPGDIVILVGGRTGRDGCGGATGSSKAHTDESMETSGAEVQKGSPVEERKILRLFRKPEVSTIIKRCNDFGAGGVSVAIGELAPGLDINLDLVPQKYQGLDGTEIAISESQERMAVVVDKANEERFIAAAREENLEATTVAMVTEEPRLRMQWKGNVIVDISRDFIDTNGAPKKNAVKVSSPVMEEDFFASTDFTSLNEGKDGISSRKENRGNKNDTDIKGNEANRENLKDKWLHMLEDINICSQKGLVQRFDSTIGRGTVLMPLGGKYQLTPVEGMAAKLPVLEGDTTTGTIMTFGYNPKIAKWSPFHGAVYAIVEAIAKVTAMGGDYRRVRLSLQEYFERLEDDPKKWGKPFSAMLGAYYAQMSLGIPAIGGKDSMSGTFNELTVPPTLVAFGVTAFDVRNTISPEFKKSGTKVVLIPLDRDIWELPDFGKLEKNYRKIQQLIGDGKVLAAHSIRTGGVAEAISKMSFGNRIGFKFHENIDVDKLFSPDYGSIVLEMEATEPIEEAFEGIDFVDLGVTIDRPVISVAGLDITLDQALDAWERPLEDVFPTRRDSEIEKAEEFSYTEGMNAHSNNISNRPKECFSKPRIFIPIFPGTASEYDLIRAFEDSGGEVETLVFKNLTPYDIKESVEEMTKAISRSQIVVIPEGISLGDELEGTGRFATGVLKNPGVFDSIMEHLKNRDGLILGLGGGFETLLNLGLISKDSIDLILNAGGYHICKIAKVRVISNQSPWFANTRVGETYSTVFSHREGQLVANPKTIERLTVNGQIATHFIREDENPIQGIESITSIDGRVLGMLGRPERFDRDVMINIPDKRVYDVFKAGINYFK